MTISKSFWSELSAHLNVSEPQGQSKIHIETICGGDINQAFRMTTGSTEYFVKINTYRKIDCFHAEKRALEKLARFCPRVISVGCIESYAFLVMEYVALSSTGDEAQLGALIAELHGITGEYYGWEEDNYIGSNPQTNAPDDNWCDFWLTQRIKPQLNMAYRHGFDELRALEERIAEAIKTTLSSYQPQPCLLHGDLWSGNKGYSARGNPLIFDPASYFGDRETDIAMTELFGGFGPRFYQAYYSYFPQREGYDTRKRIYNFYHILNHYNLFGDAYLSQCLSYANSIIKNAEIS